MSKIRIMTQNQWNNTANKPYWEERGFDCSSKVRMKGHFRVFSELMPDVVGGQEVNKEMQLDLMLLFEEEKLPYTLIWGSMTPIIYRSDKFELLEHEFYCYPEKVEKYEGVFNDEKSKNANLAVFRVKESGEIFVFLNTHLWWMDGKNPEDRWYREGSDEVRQMQLKIAIELIEKYRAKYNGCTAFLVGDLNTDYNSQAVQYAIKERGYNHAHDVATEFAHSGVGYNPCSPGNIGAWWDSPFEEAIDHILVSGNSKCQVLRFDRYTPEYYLYLSDHAPAFADIVL